MEDGIIYDTADECSKQYGCANEIWIWSVLTFTYRVKIDICINAPGHRRKKVYGINGSDKTIFFKCAL